MALTVCIPTAGRGTRMGEYSNCINKSLLPINKKAIISHIISFFPDETKFVIALGDFGKQVQHYLTIAHPDTAFKFVTVDNYEGPGSGPGQSLLCCRDELQKPFFFVSCDTLWCGNVLNTNSNWLGVAKVSKEESDQYCNIETEPKTRRIIAFHDKKSVSGDRFRAFTGLCFIKNYSDFWSGLEESEIISGENQISNGLKRLAEKCDLRAKEIEWKDVGNLENYCAVKSRYENYDFSKTNESLYIFDRRVIKFFSDYSVVEKRVRRAQLNTRVFPEIKLHAGQFYTYDYYPGKTLYQINNTRIFEKLLEWLDQNLWLDHKGPGEEMRAICQKFYREKTLSRLELFEKKYPGSNNPSKINGSPVSSIGVLIDKIPWEFLYEGIPHFIHGDLQFDNILYDQTKASFLLLDWRHSFGGCLEYGDIYYDYAKLNGGLILNYDYIKANLLRYEEDGDDIYFDFAQRRSVTAFSNILHEFIRGKGHDPVKLGLLVPIVFLNMSPLHHYPFDKMLHALGREMLNRVL